jgi:predicted Zn-dependent protease with MMP-like domain
MPTIAESLDTTHGKVDPAKLAALFEQKIFDYLASGPATPQMLAGAYLDTVSPPKVAVDSVVQYCMDLTKLGVLIALHSSESPYIVFALAQKAVASVTSDFEKIVALAIAEIPAEYAQQMQTLKIVVEAEPPASLLAAKHVTEVLGSYKRVGGLRYSSILPGTIRLYEGPIKRDHGQDPQQLKLWVAAVLWHELGHHFGMDEEQVRVMTQCMYGV